MRIVSYIFLYINFILQVIGSPLQLGRYVWVMYWNDVLGTDQATTVLNAVWDQQKLAMWTCITLWFTEPWALV